MQKKNHTTLYSSKGNAILITTILILVMTVIIGACISISGIQLDLAMLQRNTSNPYYLAKSAIEKEVDMINKAVQTEMTDNLDKISRHFLSPITQFASESDKINTAKSTTGSYTSIQYHAASKQFKIDGNALKTKMTDYIYKFLEDNYLNKNYTYKVKSDRQTSSVETEVLIKYEPILIGAGPNFKRDEFKVVVTAASKDGANVLDTQTLEAIVHINIPSTIENQIKEKYRWVGNPPEILNSAITCFSDVAVTDGAKLTVRGDIRVKGNKKVTSIDASDPNNNYYPEADESGGLIVSNGGTLEVTSAPGISYTGNIYSMSNVATTNGWDGPSSSHYNDTTTIVVEGDIIADTVGIFDDYYSGGDNQRPLGANPNDGNKVRNNQIIVHKNIFVDNDVKIDKWAATLSGGTIQTKIDVAGSIFAISDNNGVTTGPNIDPNLSSGVYNQGLGTLIKANKMFVNGQPFIVLSSIGTATRPMKLWESIGEPFDGVHSWGGYTRPTTDDSYMLGDDSYLYTASPYFSVIRKDAIEITDIDNSYATARISAKTPSTTGAIYSDVYAGLVNPSIAGQFFSKGGSDLSTITMSSLTIKNDGYGSSATEKGFMIHNAWDYYAGTITTQSSIQLWKRPGMHNKFYHYPSAAPWVENKFQGIRSFMTAMRSVFYGAFKSDGPANAMYYPQLLSFDDVATLTGSNTSWSYSNPIVITTTGGAIDINDYYITQDGVTTEPYLTVVVNTSSNKLTIENSDTTNFKTFKGIIVSKGDVELKGKMIIEGSIIIGGTNEGNLPDDRKDIMLGNTVTGSNAYSPGLKLSGSNTDVTVIQNPNILLQMEWGNVQYLRDVFDDLKITQYRTKPSVDEILGPYNYDSSGTSPTRSDTSKPIAYTLGRVLLSSGSTLDIHTEKINISIKSMKKIY